MIRRVHVPQLRPGDLELAPAAGRHLRDVLRLAEGTAVEVFDDGGATAQGAIVALDPTVIVRIEQIASAEASGGQITIAAAVPKGERADWMIEKLSELGCHRFIPLATARSIVLPEGKNKRDRWVRVATESAKQSRRAGVMQIEPLTPLKEAVDGSRDHFAGYLSTRPSANPIIEAWNNTGRVTLFIGPEGGWTDEEMDMFNQFGVRALKLTSTVLRVETAAVAAATIAAVIAAAAPSNRESSI
jgi:16S rRNA (uracil1498-N3)-methyltransferase